MSIQIIQGLKKIYFYIMPKVIIAGVALKEASLWIVLSYIVPILNIALLFLISNKILTPNIINIILSTNVAFIIGAIFSIKDYTKRTFLKTVSIVGVVVCSFFVGISTYEIEKSIQPPIEIEVYVIIALATFLISIFLAYVSKKEVATDEYNEKKVVAELIGDSKDRDKVVIDGKNINIGG